MFDRYLKEVASTLGSGRATEHSYRPALQEMLSSLFKDAKVTNEPKRQECGAPDLILERKNIPFGYVEAKDIGVDLDKVEKGGKNDTQWQRYSQSLDNLILTDYLEFRFFVNGEKVETVAIAKAHGTKLTPLPENFDKLAALLKNFGSFRGQPIKSAKKLAEMMAHKAALMRDVFFKTVSAKGDNSLKQQLAAFKEVLMHDMDAAQFADVYAQTIAYGLFTARLHDPTQDDFSRAEALTLIPKANPFLRQLFQYVAGNDLDDRVVWIVDALCEVFLACNVPNILKDFGAGTGRSDPILHFYETFLTAYDAGLRKDRGVWYTPEPVVRFIVRAVDDVLKTHFNLKDGLADISKTDFEIVSGIETKGRKKGQETKEKIKIHKVQVLDVATGTGTFLAEVMRHIHASRKGQEGTWSSYVDKDLLPRLHGFEILMASYAMCHMKLDLLLQQTGYKPTGAQPRLGVYLTDALEEHHKDSHLPFVNWLSQEANEASRIKREMPIMVAIGNPPYSGISQNKGEWITNLIEDYKYINGVHFNERKHWLQDDYVKFIRLGEHYIAKNGEGVLAYITNHGYLDNPTFRAMRWHLLTTFDDIYVLDLHGNALKKEKAPDGSPDKNVFDIQQGVAIIIAVKRQTDVSKGEKSLANLYHADLWGSRDSKFEKLSTANLKTTGYQQLAPQAPFYFFIPQNNDALAEYDACIPLNKLFPVNVTGIVTARDGMVIDFNDTELLSRIRDFANPANSDDEVRQRYFGGKKEGKYLAGDTRGWGLSEARQKIASFDHAAKVQPICYRPFDDRSIYYTPEMVDWGRDELMSNMLAGENIGIVIGRQGAVVGAMEWNLAFITTKLLDFNVFYRGGGLLFPLYTYNSVLGGVEQKQPNLDPKIWAAIRKIVKDATPESLFDYIYAVLHSRAYRTRYAEYLKSDFPRIPYPKDAATFHALAALGAQVRALHLMESPLLDSLITTYPVGGDHLVDKPRWEAGKNGLGRVWLNPTQYFDCVPQVAWEFYIGGYQPAQKWLKDRKGRSLTNDDINHWQRIVVALAETHRLMGEIDKITFLPDGNG